jgi:hypothetical protein
VGTGGLEDKENDFMYFSCLGTLANPGKRKIGGSGEVRRCLMGKSGDFMGKGKVSKALIRSHPA